jgi:Zn-dependent alcohol dehydrogenase
MQTRAAVLHEYGAPWSVEDIDLDPPRAGEVLLRLAEGAVGPPSQRPRG